MKNLKKVMKTISGLAIATGLAGVGASVVNASTVIPSLGSAEEVPTNPVAKKGDKIVVIVQNKKDQNVNMVNAQNLATGKKVKMGSSWIVKAVKKVNGNLIYRIGNQKEWINAKDIVKD